MHTSTTLYAASYLSPIALSLSPTTIQEEGDRPIFNHTSTDMWLGWGEGAIASKT